MTAPTTVLVLGGGVGGRIAANRLRKLLPRNSRILLIEQSATHVFAPSLLWLLNGDRKSKDIVRPLRTLTARGVDLIEGEITRIDPNAREVTVGDQILRGDAMIIALGADTEGEQAPGLRESGYNLYTLDGASGFRSEFAAMKAGRVVLLTATPTYKCPAAPYEAVMLLDHDLVRRGLRDKVELEMFASEPAPMGVTGPANSQAVADLLATKGIPYHPGQTLLRVDSDGNRLIFADVEVPFDLLGFVPVHKAPRVVDVAGMLSESGWIAVDRNTLATQWPNVYAIGDVTSIALSMGKPLPKAGVFAHRQAEVVAHNIASNFRGRGAMARFDGFGQCFLETGHGRAGLGSGNFYGDPMPDVHMHPPARRWHWAKILFEKNWLRPKIF